MPGEGRSTPAEKIYCVAVQHYSYSGTFVLGLGSQNFFNHQETFLITKILFKPSSPSVPSAPLLHLVLRAKKMEGSPCSSEG